MSTNISIISDQIWYALSQALVHSIWQGFVLMILVAFMLYAVKLNKPHMRYWIAVGGVLSFLLIFGITFLSSLSDYQAIQTYPFVENALSGDVQIWNLMGETAAITSFSDLINPTVITTIWLCGFLIFGLRMAFSYVYLLYVHKSSQLDETSEIYHVLQELKSKMQMSENIQLRISQTVDTIFTYGFFHPIIVWPISLFNQLNADEVSLILAHELAHIKRKDYVVKMLLNLVNVVLYYHPLVWWLNRVINNEREYACDLEALAQNGDTTQLAMVLVKLQEYKLNPATLSSNHFNDKNSFSNRIKRLFNMPIKQSFSKSKLTILLLFFAIGLFAIEYKNIKSAVIENDAANISALFPAITNAPEVSSVAQKDTIDPIKESKSSAFIIKNDGDRSVKMEMENGEIKNLEIDGKVIDKADYDQYTDELKTIEGRRFKPGDRMPFGFDAAGMEPFVFKLDQFKAMNDSIFKGFNFHAAPDSLFTKNFRFDFPGGMGLYFSDEYDNFGNMDLDNYLEHNRNYMENQREMLKKHGIDLEIQRENGLHMRENAEKMREHLEKMKPGMGSRDLKGLNDDLNTFPRNSYNFSTEPGASNLEQKLGSQLNKDGFLLPEKENSVKLTGKYLKINSEKMPQVIFEKYKRLFEEETGIPLSDKNVIEFKMEGKPTSGRKYRAF